jgi:hypothetical protein
VKAVEQAVLRRYVAQTALTALSTLRLHEPMENDVESVVLCWREHVREACAQSSLLRTHYHPNDVADAVSWAVDLARAAGWVRPRVSDTLADQLAWPALRVLGAADVLVRDSMHDVGTPPDAPGVVQGSAPGVQQ